MVHTYNPSAVDAEGDSLVYSLVAAENGSTGTTVGGPVTYISGVTPAAPLQTPPGDFFFDSTSGQMVFYTPTLQRTVAVYHIREYRGGVLVGTVEREITILINNNTNHIPAGGFSSPTACTIVDTLDISVCDTVGAFSVQIHPIDSDAADTIYVTPFGVPTGATFTTVGNATPHPVCTFSWSTSGIADGLHTFFVKYDDNACPMHGSQSIAYRVNIQHCTAIPTAINDAGIFSAGLRIYPNPATRYFEVAIEEPMINATIAITDMFGRTMKQQTNVNAASNLSMDVRSLPAGAYIVKVINAGKTYREKVVLNR
jgi:hypothetical protein